MGLKNAEHTHRTLRDRFRDSIARTLFVTAWADWTDQYGKGTPGMGVNLMDVAPKTPDYVYESADSLLNAIECENSGADVRMLCRWALSADDGHGKRSESTNPSDHRIDGIVDDLAYCLAMQSMGHGVSWLDSHKDAGIELPYFEFSYFDLDDATYPIPAEPT